MTAHRPAAPLRLTAAVTLDDGEYVARCLEVEVASQGPTVEAALEALVEALELYFEADDAVAPGPTPMIAPIAVSLPS